MSEISGDTDPQTSGDTDPQSSGATAAPSSFPIGGYMRRVRRIAELSQRECAERLGLSQSRVARMERGGDTDVRTLVDLLHLGGLRLAVVDATGTEIAPMRSDVRKDGAGRHYPAFTDPVPMVGFQRFLAQFRYDRSIPDLTFRLRSPWAEPERDGAITDHPVAESIL
jgi:HTH-type transcriptional regulator/antitoxin HipB